MAIRTPETVSEFIEALGGTGTVAAACKLTPGAVSQWRAANRIPTDHFNTLEELARRAGVEAPRVLFAFSRPSSDAAAD